MHEWEEAVCFAGDALEKFQAAEPMHWDNLHDEANMTVQATMDILKRRCDLLMLIQLHLLAYNPI